MSSIFFYSSTNNLFATAFAASCAGILQIRLTFNVIKNRRAKQIRLGAGNDPEMEAVIRAHGNFTETTPIFLILLGTFEINGGWKAACVGLGAAFLAGRIIHSGIAEEGSGKPLTSRVNGMVWSISAISAASFCNIALLAVKGYAYSSQSE